MAVDRFAGTTALVTGAAAGIGRALALALAVRGTQLVLWDRDAAGLAETARSARHAGVEVRTDVVDVASRAAVRAAAAAVERHLADDHTAAGPLRLVLCLAGTIHTGGVLASHPDDVDRVFAVNLHGTVSTVEALLPQLLAAGGGHVVTTSSAFGLVAVPGYGSYCASKAAVLAWTDALRLELALAGAPVGVSCVVPGGVRTGIVRTGSIADGEDAAAVVARFERDVARTTPEQAARAILAGISDGRARILVGRDARAVALLTRLTGTAYQRLLVAALRRRARRGRP
jgi:short-subunit dehydrogenase